MVIFVKKEKRLAMSSWDEKPLMFAHSKYWEDCSIDEDWKRVRRKKLCECKECKND